MRPLIIRNIVRATLIPGLLLCLPVLLAAHPHVFIDTSLVFQGDGQHPTQIKVEWRFDEIFSQSVFADFPKPASGIYTGKRLADLKDGAFDNLKEYGYFTRLIIDGKLIPVKTVHDFSARVDRGWVIYGFVIYLPEKSLKSKLSVSFFDQTFFVSFGEVDHKQVTTAGLPPEWQLSFAEITLKSDGFGSIKVDELRMNKEVSP